MSMLEMLLIVLILMWLVGYTVVPIGGLLNVLLIVILVALAIKTIQSLK